MHLSRGTSLDDALEVAVANQFPGSVTVETSQAYKVLKILLDTVAKNK